MRPEMYSTHFWGVYGVLAKVNSLANLLQVSAEGLHSSSLKFVLYCRVVLEKLVSNMSLTRLFFSAHLESVESV